MGLFSRTPAVEVTVSPGTAYPRQIVTATVTADVDRVTSATLDWGYTNYYRYHWAGRADSAAASATAGLSAVGEVGTTAGGDRNTDDWVSVSSVELPVTDGQFRGGTAQLRVPSWAPASSSEIAQWSCRLKVRRPGPDHQAQGDFTVVVSRDNVRIDPEPQERFTGSGETAVDIALPTTIFATGEVIRGQITLTPAQDLADGDLRVSLQRHRLSHPLTRSPAPTVPVDGPTVRLGKGIPLRGGVPVVIPFEIQVPADAAPTAEAVHSTLSWGIAAQLIYAGWTSPVSEGVRREIVVVNSLSPD